MVAAPAPIASSVSRAMRSVVGIAVPVAARRSAQAASRDNSAMRAGALSTGRGQSRVSEATSRSTARLSSDSPTATMARSCSGMLAGSGAPGTT
jgi:hypothetical protein